MNFWTNGAKSIFLWSISLCWHLSFFIAAYICSDGIRNVCRDFSLRSGQHCFCFWDFCFFPINFFRIIRRKTGGNCWKQTETGYWKVCLLKMESCWFCWSLYILLCFAWSYISFTGLTHRVLCWKMDTGCCFLIIFFCPLWGFRWERQSLVIGKTDFWVSFMAWQMSWNKQRIETRKSVETGRLF